jgi:hypothetical protein
VAVDTLALLRSLAFCHGRHLWVAAPYYFYGINKRLTRIQAREPGQGVQREGVPRRPFGAVQGA